MRHIHRRRGKKTPNTVGFFCFIILFINNISVFFWYLAAFFVSLLISIQQMGVAILFSSISLDIDIWMFFFSILTIYSRKTLRWRIECDFDVKTLLNNITDKKKKKRRETERNRHISVPLAYWQHEFLVKLTINAPHWCSKEKPIKFREIYTNCWSCACVCARSRAFTNHLANRQSLWLARMTVWNITMFLFVFILSFRLDAARFFCMWRILMIESITFHKRYHQLLLVCVCVFTSIFEFAYQFCVLEIGNIGTCSYFCMVEHTT